jgi:hypothetical protein
MANLILAAEGVFGTVLFVLGWRMLGEEKSERGR